jgi:hypothetical protein
MDGPPQSPDGRWRWPPGWPPDWQSPSRSVRIVLRIRSPSRNRNWRCRCRSGTSSDRGRLERIPPGRRSPAALPDNGPVFELFEFRDLPLNEALRLFSRADRRERRRVARGRRETRVAVPAPSHPRCGACRHWPKPTSCGRAPIPDSGVLHISTTEEYDRDLATFRDEQTEVFTLLYPNPVDVARTIQSIFGDRVLMTLG